MMAKRHISNMGMATGKARVMTAFEKYKSGSWLDYRTIEKVAGEESPRGRAYEYGYAQIYCRALVREKILTRRRFGTRVYFAVTGSSPPPMPAVTPELARGQSLPEANPNKVSKSLDELPDERTRVYTLPIEDHRAVRTIAVLFGISNDDVLHQAVEALKDKIRGTVL